MMGKQQALAGKQHCATIDLLMQLQVGVQQGHAGNMLGVYLTQTAVMNESRFNNNLTYIATLFLVEQVAMWKEFGSSCLLSLSFLASERGCSAVQACKACSHARDLISQWASMLSTTSSAEQCSLS